MNRFSIYKPYKLNLQPFSTGILDLTLDNPFSEIKDQQIKYTLTDLNNLGVDKTIALKDKRLYVWLEFLNNTELHNSNVSSYDQLMELVSISQLVQNWYKGVVLDFSRLKEAPVWTEADLEVRNLWLKEFADVQLELDKTLKIKRDLIESKQKELKLEVERLQNEIATLELKTYSKNLMLLINKVTVQNLPIDKSVNLIGLSKSQRKEKQNQLLNEYKLELFLDYKDRDNFNELLIDLGLVSPKK